MAKNGKGPKTFLDGVIWVATSFVVGFAIWVAADTGFKAIGVRKRPGYY